MNVAVQHAARFDQLTRDEIRNIVPDSLIVVPFGATEQHGPHLPTGTDTLHLDHVVDAAIARIAHALPVVVTPTVPYGCSEHHLPFGATVSLSNDTYLRLVHDIGRSLALAGCRKLFFINGHGGNHHILQVAAHDLVQRFPLDIAMASWWELAIDQFRSLSAPLSAKVPGHAGAFETSVGLAVHPHLVRTRPADRQELPPAGLPLPMGSPAYTRESNETWKSYDGFSDFPARADQTYGVSFAEIAINALAEAFIAFGSPR